MIIFEFAGRRPNMELQLPFIKRILAENPNTECHLWNLARTTADADYITNITSDRITIRHDFYTQHRAGWNRVYHHYGSPEYEGSVFVKLDDDIVFLETQRFTTFTKAITANPGTVLSANVINNGACTPLNPELWHQYQQLNIPLLDVHKSNQYGDNSHNHFFHHHHELLDQPIKLVPTKDWLSINAIGYDWTTAQHFARTVGTVPHPQLIAGRRFPSPWGIGDETAGNMRPRIIMDGFTACHLTFGPQHPTTQQLDTWRAEYADIGDDYLASAPAAVLEELPELSPLSWKFRGVQGEGEDNKDVADWAIRSGWHPTDSNDPTVGRFKP